jgi:hypothetical protein
MTDQIDRSVLPISRPPFAGVAGKTLDGSQPDWGLIGHVKPPAGAPNVLAQQDFDALVKLVTDKQLTVEGVALVTNDADGNVSVTETGDHLGRKGLEEKMGAALPPGSASIVAIYDRAKASTVDATLASAVRKSVAHVDGHGAKKLKAALADAQAGLGG